MSLNLKSSEALQSMRRASMIVYEVHEHLKEHVKPGITTLELDSIAKEYCLKYKAKPAFLNYPASQKGIKPFPGVICASPNDVIVHGIPDSTPLKDGDILSIDFGCEFGGYFGDSARTYPIGNVTERTKLLLKKTEESLEKAISQCFVGNRIGDISNIVQRTVEPDELGVVREFVGHGIGTKMHEPPHVPNFGQPKQGRPLKVGMVLAIEPMITEGSYEIKIDKDGWTARTMDGSNAAHFEHTVAITEKGPWVLSRP
jgi:methionyl aminopeptidase